MFLSNLEIYRLLPAHRSALGLHLLSLSSDDRYDRFGMALQDETILKWVSNIDWQSQRWWGAWLPSDIGLVGALQLSPCRQENAWELAITVNALIRRHGIGSLLLASAVEQSSDVHLLLCQHGHKAMRAISKELGYKVVFDSDFRILKLQIKLN